MMEEVKELTECSICTETFSDPRMLPCVHSFCLRCLEKILLNSDSEEEGSMSEEDDEEEEEEEEGGGKMSCPICREEFIIPKEGLQGLKKNFFMQKLIEIAKVSEPGDMKELCEICIRNKEEASDKIPLAAKYCIDCREKMCDRCGTRHKNYKLSMEHQIIPLDNELSDEVVRKLAVQYCDEHCKEEMKLYCISCEKVVCMMCFAVKHQNHKCVEIDKMADEFLKKLDTDLKKVIAFSADCTAKIEKLQQDNKELMKIVENTERTIIKRANELKELIDIQMKSLLEDLSAIKEEKLKYLQNEEQENKEVKELLNSFITYCDELKRKGSHADLCQSIVSIQKRTDALKIMQRTVVQRNIPSVNVSFKFSNFQQFTKNENIIGTLEAVVKEAKVLVFGRIDGRFKNKEVFEFNLDRPNETNTLQPVPTIMQREAVAVNYYNNIFVIGIGKDKNEIWKYKRTSGWTQCAPLVEGRCRHCAEIIDYILYIFGGYVDSQSKVLKSVETYDLLENKCTTVGELVKGVMCFATSAYKGLIYTFGGLIEGEKATDCVQMYNISDNTCSLFSKSLPFPCGLLKSVSMKSAVILLNKYNCFIFHFETGIFQQKIQFKADVSHNGIVLHDDKVYVFGGGTSKKGADGKFIWKSRDDIRCVALSDIINNKSIEWKHCGRLPKPTLIHAYALLFSLRL